MWLRPSFAVPAAERRGELAGCVGRFAAYLTKGMKPWSKNASPKYARRTAIPTPTPQWFPTAAGRAARKIGQYGGPEHLPVLEAAAKHRHERVRDDAADALKALKARTAK